MAFANYLCPALLRKGEERAAIGLCYGTEGPSTAFDPRAPSASVSWKEHSMEQRSIRLRDALFVGIAAMGFAAMIPTASAQTSPSGTDGSAAATNAAGAPEAAPVMKHKTHRKMHSATESSSEAARTDQLNKQQLGQSQSATDPSAPMSHSSTGAIMPPSNTAEPTTTPSTATPPSTSGGMPMAPSPGGMTPAQGEPTVPPQPGPGTPPPPSAPTNPPQ